MPRTFNKWSEEEVAKLQSIVKKIEGKNSFCMKEMKPLFPGKTEIQIWNRLKRERADLRKLCSSCGQPREWKNPDKKSCSKCRQKSKDRRDRLKRDGICTVCEKRPALASATRCQECTDKIRKAYKKTYRRKQKSREKGICTRCHKNKAKKDSQFCAECYPKVSKSQREYKKKSSASPKNWPFFVSNSKILFNSIEHFPRDLTVVDVFGGSGRLTQKAIKLGFNGVVYNDIHPFLTGLMRACGKGDTYKLIQATKNRLVQLSDEQMVEEYEILLDIHKNNPSRVCDNPYSLSLFAAMCCKGLWRGTPMEPRKSQKSPTGLRDVEKFTKMVTVENLDWRDIFEKYDAEDTLFLLDPPWPGVQRFDYRMDNYSELIDAILELKGEWALGMHSSRESLRYMSRLPLLYRKWCGISMELIASSRPFPEAWIPVDPLEYGSKTRTELIRFLLEKGSEKGPWIASLS